MLHLSNLPHSLVLNKVRQALDDKVMFVGGFVRDSLLGVDTLDIDMATPFMPEETLQRLKTVGLNPLSFGIKFGMVQVIDDETGAVIEITSLREDVIPLGRRAIVRFGADIEQDAKRRDFTINALYSDLRGNVYDVLGLSQKDLYARKIRFIGDASERIKEDSLRILRYFRFVTYYGKGKIDRLALEAIKDNVSLLNKLSPERINEELYKIISFPDKKKVLRSFKLMQSTKVLSSLWSDFTNLDYLEALVTTEEVLNYAISSDLYFVSIFLPLNNKEQVTKLKNKLRLSNQQEEVFTSILAMDATIEAISADLVKALYIFGKDTVINCLCLSELPLQEKERLLQQVLSTSIPVFPLMGEDLIQQGIPAGKALGETLKQKKKEWIDSDFSQSKQQILESLKEKE